MKVITGIVEKHTHDYHSSYWIDYYKFPDSLLTEAVTNVGKTLTVEIADNTVYIKRVIK